MFSLRSPTFALLSFLLSQAAAHPLLNITARDDTWDMLFPVHTHSHWTTAPDLSNALPLADSTFRPFDEITSLSHDYVDAPDGQLSMQAYYPAGSYNFQHSPQGGFSFYAPGPSSVNLEDAKEATFSYSVYFPHGFDFVKGGKMPGLCKCISPRKSLTAISCTLF